jgi:hypothetical protein
MPELCHGPHRAFGMRGTQQSTFGQAVPSKSKGVLTMKSVRFSHRALMGAVLSAFLTLIVVGASFAQSSDGAGYPTLVNDVPMSGGLTGNRAGAFAYYMLDYPGDLRVVTIELQFAPADPVTRLGFGFNVYGPNGFVIGQGAEDENGDGEPVRLQYSDANKATWLVQVYNYIPGHRVSYALVVRGLPELQLPPGPLPTASVSRVQAGRSRRRLRGHIDHDLRAR